MKFKLFCNTIIIVSTGFLSACDELGSQFTTDDETNVINATSPEDRWEYLVVSFGKASFQTINEGIQDGSSKLAAFREFSDLLSGYEGISLQNKLDLLGRFGWELINTVGSIGGDQQFVLKRERREGRIEKEKKVLEKLSVILKVEKDKKAAELEAYIEKLTNQVAKSDDDGLVELDAMEKKEREFLAAKKAKEIIKPWLPVIDSSVCKNTVIKQLRLNVTASESSRKGLTYEGTVKVDIDATEALLIKKNHYRKSEANKLASICTKQILSNVQGYKEKSHLSGFELEGNIQITYDGKTETVSSMYQSFNIKQFPSYWDRY